MFVMIVLIVLEIDGEDCVFIWIVDDGHFFNDLDIAVVVIVIGSVWVDIIMMIIGVIVIVQLRCKGQDGLGCVYH